ncbi:hypothetical protein [Pseudoalteromonas luteoviolacea]|uniref:Uncharacterized protein n=1 Tax=Pseudoalteromonas luteoviolacea S4060-1 TaxID=1365257 RepID=A0A167KVT4_9GAMM|nr:hypothetical protein [Pseudoalteromonas luteoviolacea]KZN63367.1 hypothetical protein N478_03700 [Pseudoalteromonas luteoviolacea S4060-1]
MLYKSDKIVASKELIFHLFDEFSQNTSLDELVSKYGLSKDHLIYIRELNLDGVHPLSALINAREAVEININYPVINEAISIVANCTESEIKDFKASVTEKYKFEFGIEFNILNEIFTLLSDGLNSIYETSSRINTPFNVKTLSLLANLSVKRFRFLPYLLLNRKAYTFQVNKREFTFAIRAFSGKKRSVNKVTSLIKRGADYKYVNEKNGFCSVSTSYFDFMQGYFGVQHLMSLKLKDIPHLKRSDCWNIYQEQLNKGCSLNDALIFTSDKTKVPIFLVLKTIEKFELEDEDDDDLLDELLDVINS